MRPPLPLLLAIGALAIAAALPFAPAGAQPSAPTLSKSELRTAPPEETHRRLRDMVWSLFEQEDFRSERTPAQPLTDLALATRPRSTQVPGLCRLDLAWIDFAPAGASSGETDADTPMQAVGLRVSPRFHFVEPPPPTGYYRIDRQRAAADPACAGTPREVHFFEAEDELVATDGYRSFLNLQEALRGGGPVALRCDLGPAESRSCSEVLLSLDQSSLLFVEDCQSPDLSTLCFLVDAFDYRVRLFVTNHVTPGPPALQLLRAEVSAPIVMSHERID